MHLQDVGTTYKAAMDALNNHFEPEECCVLEASLSSSYARNERVVAEFCQRTT